MLLFSVTPQILAPVLASTFTILCISPVCLTVVLPAIGVVITASHPTSYNPTLPMPTAALPALQIGILTGVAMPIYTMETACAYLGCRTAEIRVYSVSCFA